jgi:N-acetylneuraminic acid mutarotase
MLNDLWKYDPATNQWTWTAGSKTSNRRGTYGTLGKRYLSNNPGGRDHFATWINASGELWLFGGDGYDSDGLRNYINDMWKYVR